MELLVAGIQAVPTLSRLNRAHPGKDTTYVLDLVNDTEEVLTAFKTVNPPFSAGTFDWDIPWLFRVIGSKNEKAYFTATHSEVVDAAGRMTISKAGVSISCNAADATSAK